MQRFHQTSSHQGTGLVKKWLEGLFAFCIQNSKNRPSVEDLLKHPWIGQPDEITDATLPSKRTEVDPDERMPDSKIETKSNDLVIENSETNEKIPSENDDREISNKGETKTSPKASISGKKTQRQSLEMLPESTNQLSTSQQSLEMLPESRKQLAVVRMPSLPAFRFPSSQSSNTHSDDSEFKKTTQSLNMVHMLFSKTEEQSISNDQLATLNRLPSYAFFPTNKQRTQLPAHRLDRELTGSPSSFTDRLIKKPHPNRTSLVRFQDEVETITIPKEEKKARRRSILNFMKKK